MLTQGSADATRAQLHPVLRQYFDAMDANGDGTVDDNELVGALEHIGMGSRAREVLESVRENARQHDHAPTNGAGAGTRGADGGLTFEQFATAVEEALMACGYDARRQWKKLNLATKAMVGIRLTPIAR